MMFEPNLQGDTLEIDSLELLIRFVIICKNLAENNELKSQLLGSADIVSAVYYYRKFPNVEDFINLFMKNTGEYFQIQWARKTWAEFSRMSHAELSELVINKISFVANLEKEQ